MTVAVVFPLVRVVVVEEVAEVDIVAVVPVVGVVVTLETDPGVIVPPGSTPSLSAISHKHTKPGIETVLVVVVSRS